MDTHMSPMVGRSCAVHGRPLGFDEVIVGQQAAQRNVGDGLAVHGVGQELADVRGGGREVVGVLSRF